VWATPPFMHNGSVPNLYEMLLPAKERTKQFYVGREFDPVKVGLDTSGASGKFLHDTAQRETNCRPAIDLSSKYGDKNGRAADGLLA